MPATYQTPPSARKQMRRARRAEESELQALQRARLMAAALGALEDAELHRLTVARILDRARVSRKTFYDVFEDVEDCFLATFEQGLDRIRALAVATYLTQPDWRTGIRSAVAAVLELLEHEPGLARLCVVDALSAGERVQQRRARALAELAAAFELGRECPDPKSLAGRAIAGGILALLHERLVDREHRPPTELQGALTGMIMMPYLGRAAAREEHTIAESARDATRPRPPRKPGAGNPLDTVKIRLTYRTIRVLGAIHENPGASNRDIAQQAGIHDQGQISKLLKRLIRLELVVNVGEGQAKGACNEWHLTPLGAQVGHATRGQ
jgi:AcrR family transcriptional regulator